MQIQDGILELRLLTQSNTKAVPRGKTLTSKGGPHLHCIPVTLQMYGHLATGRTRNLASCSRLSWNAMQADFLFEAGVFIRSSSRSTLSGFGKWSGMSSADANGGGSTSSGMSWTVSSMPITGKSVMQGHDGSLPPVLTVNEKKKEKNLSLCVS